MQELDDLLDDALTTYLIDNGATHLETIFGLFMRGDLGNWTDERIVQRLAHLIAVGIVERYPDEQLYFVPDK